MGHAIDGLWLLKYPCPLAVQQLGLLLFILHLFSHHLNGSLVYREVSFFFFWDTVSTVQLEELRYCREG